MEWARPKYTENVKRGLAATAVLLLAFLLCILEGALRKWMFRGATGNSNYILYFSKDIAFALVVLLTPSQRNIDSSLKKALILGLPLIVLGALMSSAGSFSPVGSFLSARALIVLPILCLLAVPRLRGMNVQILAMVIGVLTIANAALGTIQARRPADDPINFYADAQSTGSTAVFQEIVRSSGTFSYITGLGIMASVGAWAGLLIISYSGRRKMLFLIGLAVYLSGLWCALVSISRSATLFVLAMLLLWLLGGKEIIRNLVGMTIGLIVVAVVAVALGLDTNFGQMTGTLMERHEVETDTVEGRAFDPVLEIGDAIGFAPFGNGFGTEQVGGMYADYGIMSFHTFEGQFARLVMECGIIGLCGFLIVSIGALKALYNQAVASTDLRVRRATIASLVLVASLFYTNVAFNHIASFFAWAIIAVSLAAFRNGSHSDPRLKPEETLALRPAKSATSI